MLSLLAVTLMYDHPRPTTAATFRCVGIVAPFPPAGAENGAPAGRPTPRYRKQGEAAWNVGHPLCAAGAERQFRGSLVDLQPGTVYEIELQYPGAQSPAKETSPDPSAPEGRSNARLVVSTRAEPAPAATGEELYVAPDGDDANPGTKERPFRTIQNGADQARPGDVVRIRAGTYPEQVSIKRSGVPGRYITFKNEGDGKVVVDGARTRDHNVALAGNDYVRIQGLTLKDAKRSAVYVGEGSDHVLVEDNVILDPGSEYFDSGVEVTSGCAGAVVRRNRILFERGTYTGGRMGISLRKTNGGHVVCQNVIQGNGLIKDGVGGESNFEINGGPFRDSDIYENTISGCQDDGIEAEGGNINVRIWGNRIRDCLVGLAVAPVIKGPCYVWRNVLTGNGSAFKLGEGDRKGHGALFLYHNTVYSARARSAGYAGAGGQGLFQNVRARNNLLTVNGNLFYDNRKERSNSYDYDLLHGLDPERFMYWGKNNKIGLVEAQALGFWRHAVTGDPHLARPDAGDYALREDSPAIDRGEKIPGFNDDFKGKAPDIGAFERQ